MGYSTLLNIIKPTRSAIEKKSKYVFYRGLLKINGMPDDSNNFIKLKESSGEIDSVDYSVNGDGDGAYQNVNWADSVALAQRYGSWIYNDQLIDFSSNTLYALPKTGGLDLWATTGSQLIFFKGSQIGPDFLIIGFDLQGNKKWDRKLKPLSTLINKDGDFWPRNFKLTATDLLIYGVYSDSTGGRPSVDITISIPIAQLHNSRKVNRD